METLNNHPEQDESVSTGVESLAEMPSFDEHMNRREEAIQKLTERIANRRQDYEEALKEFKPGELLSKNALTAEFFVDQGRDLMNTLDKREAWEKFVALPAARDTEAQEVYEYQSSEIDTALRGMEDLRNGKTPEEVFNMVKEAQDNPMSQRATSRIIAHFSPKNGSEFAKLSQVDNLSDDPAEFFNA